MVSIGGVNLLEALVSAEQRIAVLEKIVEALLNAGPVTNRELQVNVERIREDALADLQRKYPELGIKGAVRG